VLGLIATSILIPERSRDLTPSLWRPSARTRASALFALFVNRWGWTVAELALLVCATASWLLMELMNRWFERIRPRAGTPGRTGGQ